jgi:hypothetical protein
MQRNRDEKNRSLYEENIKNNKIPIASVTSHHFEINSMQPRVSSTSIH